MPEPWAAGLEVLAILLSETRISLLLALLFAAALIDLARHRIPNLLVFPGAIVGIVYNALFSHGLGISSAMAGLGVGLAAMLPLYFLRAMGAGDVKLMAMVGAYLGPWDTLGAVLGTFLAGGVIALVVVIKTRAVGRLFRNLKFMVTGTYYRLVLGEAPAVDAPPATVGKVPYGVAIALGTAGFILGHGFGLFYWFSEYR